MARRAVALPHGEAKQMMERFRADLEARETIAQADSLLVLRGDRPRKRYLT